MIDGEQAIKLKAEIIKYVMILDVQTESTKMSYFRLPVILGVLHVQSSDPPDLNSDGSYLAIQIHVSLPGYIENTDHS